MKRYIAKRVFSAFIVLIGITLIDFLIMNLAGDPVEIMSGGPRVSKELLELRAQNLGLDKPVIVQYFYWLKAILGGDLGFSYTSFQPVSEMIASHLYPTLVLMGTALVISTLISAAAGIYSALNQGKLQDHAVVSLAFAGQSIPGFLLALILIYIFSVRLGLLPTGGMKTLGAGTDGPELSFMILPVTVLAFEMCGRNIRYIRSSVLEILNKGYLTAAKARGIGQRRLVFRHILKNALIPILTVIGMELPGLFGGAVIIEQVFSWPGLGLMTMNAVLARDYPVIMAVCLLSAVVVLIGNLVVDIAYAFIDPAVRYD